jgi:hypothetical protein
MHKGPNVQMFTVAKGFVIGVNYQCCAMFSCNGNVNGAFTSEDGRIRQSECYFQILQFPPAASKVDGGGIFLIIFGVGAAAYCGVGIMLGRKKGLSGRDALPNLPFWTALPGLTKDGCGFFFWCCKRRVGLAVANNFKAYEEL